MEIIWGEESIGGRNINWWMKDLIGGKHLGRKDLIGVNHLGRKDLIGGKHLGEKRFNWWKAFGGGKI